MESISLDRCGFSGFSSLSFEQLPRLGLLLREQLIQLADIQPPLTKAGLMSCSIAPISFSRWECAEKSAFGGSFARSRSRARAASRECLNCEMSNLGIFAPVFF